MRRLNFDTSEVPMFDDEVGRLLRHDELIDPVQASWALDEATDLKLGLYLRYDDVATVRPMAVIALHPKEELYSGTLFDRWASRFAEYELGSCFNITLGEFLQMDVASATVLYNIAKERLQTKLKSFKKMQEEEKKLKE